MSYFQTFNLQDEDETQIVVEFSCRGGEAATYDDPGCGPEVEIIDAWRKADENMVHPPRITLSDDDDARICMEIMENPPEDDGPDPDDERDQRRDDAMMEKMR